VHVGILEGTTTSLMLYSVLRKRSISFYFPVSRQDPFDPFSRRLRHGILGNSLNSTWYI